MTVSGGLTISYRMWTGIIEEGTVSCLEQYEERKYLNLERKKIRND